MQRYKAVGNSKMATKILDDILSNFISVDTLLDWLSKTTSVNEDNVFLNQFECNQIDFVSYFLVFLKEQSSRDFQVYDAETPRKNSTPAVSKSSPPSKTHHNSSAMTHHLDLESLQSFPTLSSSSSNLESEKKHFESTPDNSFNENSNRNNFEKKVRRVKLFSETLEGNAKENNTFKKELELFDDVELKTGENKFVVSTPKPFKNHSVINCFNTSDFQLEISPKPGPKSKWKNQSPEGSPEISLLTPKSRSYSGDSSHRTKDNKMCCRMSLGDFILSEVNTCDNKKDKKNKPRKRINPVKVSSLSHISVNSSFSEKTDSSLDSSMNSTQEGRQSFKLENKQIAEDASSKEKPFDIQMTPEKITSNCFESQAALELATCTNELKALSQIYSFLIDENYCQNIMMEFCFIISLLVIQDCSKKISDYNIDCKSIMKGKKLFESIHNCVFFAVETLWLQRNCLLFLNLSALKLLSENDRIGKFNVKLKEFLVSAYKNRQSNEESKRHNGLIKTGMQGFVSFQYETDNRENFTSDVSFHSFRKQRDLFYNILAIWEANHAVSGWIFSIGLSSKIRSLLSISSDPINLLHLSRLFRNQLVMSCCSENQTQEDINEEILQLLPSADPNKILRLRARLTSSPKRQGPCPVPDFTGHQEFYKDFILCTSYSSFHEHLKNSLCDEILRLNETELTGDIEDEDLCMDEQIQERYFQCTNILRLLAKFLGFVEFLPYRGEKPHSDRILNIHCSVRNSTLPLFDVESCLNAAIKKHKLTLTIPWMVSYLSMIDSYSAHLKTYQTVWRLLVRIYKDSTRLKSGRNKFYLKLSLGWLFQQPNFPSESFLSGMSEWRKWPREEFSAATEAKPGLDSYDFAEEKVLYAACPFLNEVNAILTENSGCAVKHIRPVTTRECATSKSQASKQLELRLESNFLHNQSSSTRKTVEFVTERVASIAIKHLIYNVVPKIKEKSWTELENLLGSDFTEAKTEAEALSEECYRQLLTVCERENWEVSIRRANVAVKALLSDDLQGSVADTCAKIVARQAAEKVQRWMQSHVTLAMVKKEFLSVTRKALAKKLSESSIAAIVAVDSSEISSSKSGPPKNSYHLAGSGRGAEAHSVEAWPASHALKIIRELIWKVNEDEARDDEVEEVIDETANTITGRSDIIPAAEKTLLLLLLDLIVLFCIRSESEVAVEIFNKFFRLLKSADGQNHPQNSLNRIICPRNVALVRNKARCREKAWRNLGNFLLRSMDEEVLTRDQAETQLLSLLRLTWDKDEGIQLSNFISEILNRYSRNNGCDKFSLLLEYMMDTFSDDEPKTESLG